MAVTQDSFTGNGTKTDYDFTFPYLKQSEVKASLDGTATTNFRFLTATKIQFVNNTTDNTPTAPASGVKIKIFRETETSSLAATFYAGSAIKSEDLNDNFTQNLYASQEVTERYLSNLGGTMTGDLNLGEDVIIKFEGATDNAHETILTVTDPTADRTITLPNVTGTVVTTGDTGTVATGMIAADAIDGTKIADDTINSEHYAAASIDTEHIADAQVTTAKLAADAVTTAKITDANVTTAKIADANITTAKIAADAITGAKIADDQIDSEHYAAGSIDTEHIADSQITSAKIADATIVAADLASNAVTTAKITDANVTTAKIADSNVTTAKLADNAVTTAKVTDANITTAKLADNAVTTAKITDANVTTAKIADANITTAKIADDNVTTAKIPDNAITTAKIADAELTTLAGMPSGTASRLADSTALTATTAELNLLDNKSFRASGDGALTTTSDTEIPSSKVIASHVAAQIGNVGGFTTIATDAAFPATASQPANGVIISISDAAGIVVNGSGVSTTGRTTDGTPATVTINNFPSSLNGETLASGVGLLVTSTGSSNTYTYHKLLAAESDVKQLSDDINDFNARYRVAGSAPSSNNDAGDLYFDTAANKMKVYNGTTSAWDDVASVGNFYINTISSSSGTGGGSATFNGSAYRFTLSNPPTMAQQLIVSVNGVIQKPNAGSSQPSEGFAISGNDIIFSAAPASGSDYFIVTQGSSVSIGTPSDNTVATAKIQNLAVNNDKIANDTIAEGKLDVHNAPATGKYLKYTSNGMEWADGASEGTDVKSTGESTVGKFLRTDGDGTCSWTTSAANLTGINPQNISSGELPDGVLATGYKDDTIKEVDLKISNTPTNGQFLQSSNTTGGLTWADVSAAPEITATASGAIAADKAVIVNSNGTVSVPTATAPALGSQGTAGSAIVGQGHHQVHYDATTGKIVLVWIKSWFPYAKVGTVSGTSITWGNEVQLSTGGWDVRRLGDLVYDSTNDKYVVTFTQANDSGGIRSTWFTVSGTTVTWGGSSSQQTIQATNGQHIRAVYTGSGKIAVAYGDAFNNIVMKTGTIGSGSNNITWAGSTTTVEASGGNMYMGLVYDPDNSNVIIIYSGQSTTMYYRVQGLTNSGSGINNGAERTYSTHTATSQVQICHHPRGSGSGAGRIIVFAHQSTSQTNPVTNNGLHYRVGSVSGDTITFGSNVEVTNGWSTHPPRIATAYNAERKKTVFIYGDTGTGNYYPRLREITVTDGSTNSSMSSATTVIANVVTDLNMVYDSTTKQDVIFYETSGHASAYKIRSAESSTANTGNFIGFSTAAYSDGNTATIAVTGNTSTQSSLTAGQKYYLQNDGSISTTSSSMEAGIALSSTKLLIKG